MHPLFWARTPAKGPGLPRHWSYSALASWRACPLQWYLARSKYDAISGPGYPPRPTASAILGQVVHAALQKFASSTNKSTASTNGDGEARVDFPIRMSIRKELEAALGEIEHTNPRGDASNIRAQIDLDDCVNLFKRLVVRLPKQTGGIAHGNLPQGQPTASGVELWVELDDPPILGRLDIVSQGGIVDFKTGEASSQHAEQLNFYAVLWWLRTGVPPLSLELVYARPPRTESIPIPSLGDLRQIRENLKAEIIEATQTLLRGTPDPKPNSITCERCNVRQICGAYWVSPSTAQLRAQSLQCADDGGNGQQWRRDIYIEGLPTAWLPGSPCVGTAYAPDLGEVAIRLDRSKCPDAGERRPQAARVIGAMITRGANGWEIVSSKSTEVFWLG